MKENKLRHNIVHKKKFESKRYEREKGEKLDVNKVFDRNQEKSL
jgi:hypothetical protein